MLYNDIMWVLNDKILIEHNAWYIVSVQKPIIIIMIGINTVTAESIFFTTIALSLIINTVSYEILPFLTIFISCKSSSFKKLLMFYRIVNSSTRS